VKRREFITFLGGATVGWPLVANAQQAAMPVIGVLAAAPALLEERRMLAFRRGLAENGYAEGQNVALVYVGADSDYERFSVLAAELVRRNVSVIVTPNSTAATLAAKAVTASIPIVFSAGGDPVQFGIVGSLARPGSNLTGVHFLTSNLGAKRLGLLLQLLPAVGTVVLLFNPANPTNEPELQDVQKVAQAAGVKPRVLKAVNADEIDAAFATFVRERPDAFMPMADPFLLSRRVQIVLSGARYGGPAVYSAREFAEIGGLMSYSTSNLEVYHQLGVYTGRVLGGAYPSDLPVVQSTKFELVINLQASRALSIEIPATLLATADEVIE
jgi:putative ABC transport system substrate-binding protein